MYIKEAKDAKSHFIGPCHDKCHQLVWDGNFNYRYGGKVNRKDINSDEIINWLDENYDKFEKPV